MTTQPRRFVRMFKPRFAKLVIDGHKRQTIRPIPKRMPEPGDIFDARQWSGKPYEKGTYKIKLIEAPITKVREVRLDGWYWCLDGRKLDTNECNDLAIADGFHNFVSMGVFFQEQYSIFSKPFKGILIKWVERPFPYFCKDCGKLLQDIHGYYSCLCLFGGKWPTEEEMGDALVKYELRHRIKADKSEK